MQGCAHLHAASLLTKGSHTRADVHCAKQRDGNRRITCQLKARAACGNWTDTLVGLQC